MCLVIRESGMTESILGICLFHNAILCHTVGDKGSGTSLANDRRTHTCLLPASFFLVAKHHCARLGPHGVSLGIRFHRECVHRWDRSDAESVHCILIDCHMGVQHLQCVTFFSVGFQPRLMVNG